MVKTLGAQLDEIENSLSKAREAISYKSGDNEVNRSYIQLISEKKEILAKIARYGCDYIEGQNSAPARRGPRIKKAVWK